MKQNYESKKMSATVKVRNVLDYHLLYMDCTRRLDNASVIRRKEVVGRYRLRGGNTEVFLVALKDFGYSAVITLRIKMLHLGNRGNLRSHGEFFLRAGRNRVWLARELKEHSRLPASCKVYPYWRCCRH
jgi:hypothetical protein